ncbi:MAG: hypothetical protein AAF221_05245 [Pseudomonadota bacterium]
MSSLASKVWAQILTRGAAANTYHLLPPNGGIDTNALQTIMNLSEYQE